jgi:hypothetical protein
MSFGRVSTYTTGTQIMVAADALQNMKWKVGGITLDWATVAAVAADTLLADGTLIPNGQKGIEYGTVLCRITATGFYGPYNSGATDGRQTLARGACFILNESVLQTVPFGIGSAPTNHPAVFEGGKVWKARLKAATVGTVPLPAYSALEAALPLLEYVDTAL